MLDLTDLTKNLTPPGRAYRIYQDPTAYPSESVLSDICKAYDVQPGDCLEYVEDEDLSDDINSD